MLYLVAQIGMLLAVAMGIGVVAGWLFFGGRSKSSGDSTAAALEQADLREQIESLEATLDEREADVARLRSKLRRAATELERRALQVTTARRAYGEMTTRLSEADARLIAADGERVALEQRLVDAAVNPTLWSAANADPVNDAANVAQAANLAAESAALNDRIVALGLENDQLVEARDAAQRDSLSARDLSDELRQRLAEADGALDELRTRVAHHEQSGDELRVQLETERTAHEREVAERDQRIDGLRLDLASARLRTDAATRELSDVSTEIGSAHQESDRQVRETHDRLKHLGERIEAAKGALSGQAVQLGTSSVPPPDQPAVPAAGAGSRMPDSELLSLPAMTTGLVSHLRELNVTTLDEIAQWSPSDVAEYENWLPDFPAVISLNRWVDVARDLIERRSRG